MRGRTSSLLFLTAVLCSACGLQPNSELHDCEGLADRWVVLQQQILDSLDGSESGVASFDNHGAAMIEQARDASAVGCSDQVAAGSRLICVRVDQLRPMGPVGEAVIANLRAACG